MKLAKMLLVMSAIFMIMTGIATAAQRMAVIEYYTNLG